VEKMSDERVINRLVHYALGALEYDDHNPDVGMGMFPQTAVRGSVKEVENECMLWTGKSITITQEEIRQAIDRVMEIKYKNRYG
jgi:hypothetical protein